MKTNVYNYASLFSGWKGNLYLNQEFFPKKQSGIYFPYLGFSVVFLSLKMVANVHLTAKSGHHRFAKAS